MTDVRKPSNVLWIPVTVHSACHHIAFRAYSVISFYTFAFIQVFSVNLVYRLKMIQYVNPETEKLVKANNQVFAAA